MGAGALLLYALLGVLAALLLAEGYGLYRLYAIPPARRRRLLRVKVPAGKAMTCRILEPAGDASVREFVVDDLTMAGIAFFADHKIERQTLRLSIRFPFTTFKDAATVWGKVVYSTRCGNEDRYRTGISYLRRPPALRSAHPRNSS